MCPTKTPITPNNGWLGWSVFLGVSWTWCIGMYLPVILIHDYGAWAWLVFAVPNVIGAAAMAWTIDAQRSRLMVEAHRPAVTAFSAITVAFQLFFAVWAFSRPPWQAAYYPYYLLGAALIALAAVVRKWSRVLAIIIFVASVVCAIGMFQHGEARVTEPGIITNLAKPPPLALIWLTPVCLFGFLLCPYLDATFHFARQQQTDQQARRSFGIGFGIIFLSAILLSLVYAKPLHVAIDSHQAAPLILRWVKVYWMMQLGFTIGAHLVGDGAQDQEQRFWTTGVIAAAGTLIAAIALLVGQKLMLPGETVYRGFLGFYGLAFPAYVWLAVIPGKGLIAPTRRVLIVLTIAIAVTLPMFSMAFIGQQLIWAVPGVAIVLLSRAFVAQPVVLAAPVMLSAIESQQNSAPTS